MSTDIGFRAWLRGEAFVESILSNFPVKSVGYIATIVVTSRAQNSRLVDKINVRPPLAGFLARFSERGTRCHDRRSTLSWQEPGEQHRWLVVVIRAISRVRVALFTGVRVTVTERTISNDIEHAGHILLVDRKLFARTCSFRDTRGNAVSPAFEDKPRVLPPRR